ncbi:hypothetical protein Q5P01_005602 [Channa striata]|uniref:Uncharacterized protein n=1 Tax=Channa striata TaxID=64152 RepID=A0AA88NGQ9_CHASR|nr:hypothetical protein Q5P01_005602 [Channa striata]
MEKSDGKENLSSLGGREKKVRRSSSEEARRRKNWKLTKEREKVKYAGVDLTLTHVDNVMTPRGHGGTEQPSKIRETCMNENYWEQ